MSRLSQFRRLGGFLALGCLVGLGVFCGTAIPSASIGGVAKRPLERPLMPAWAPRSPAPVVSAGETKSVAARPVADATRVRAVSVASTVVLETGAAVALPLFDGRVAEGVITLLREQSGGRRLAGGPLDGGGHFVLARGPSGWSGMIFPAGDEHVYRLTSADDGGEVLAAIPRGKILCATLPGSPDRSAAGRVVASGGAAVARALPVPVLDSRPDVEPVLYLDFDGETVVDPFWAANPIVAADSGLGDAAITRVWRRVAEDFRPFRINVTTDPARYAAARPMQRMRCIVTTSSAWYGSAGGVAGIYSWREAGVDVITDDMPCWAFADQISLSDDIGMAVSHEAGHTLGLSHDGLKNAAGAITSEYYPGHGSGASSWGSIMGAPYGKSVIHWNKGDYASGSLSANNQEDDIAIIAGIENHTGFASELQGETTATAGRLGVSVDGATVDHRGVVLRGGSESRLLVATGAGAVSLALVPDEDGDGNAVNFDGSLTLSTLGGSTVAIVDTVGTRFPQLNTTVAEGVYVLRVRSVGEGSPIAGGYSSYGSIGRFHVTGSVPPPVAVAPVIGGAAAASGRVGDAFAHQIAAAGTGLVYSGSGLPPGLGVTTEGFVAGVPTQAGVFSAMLTVANGLGAVNRTVTFSIAGTTLAEALGAPSLVFNTGGDRPWFPVAEAGAPSGGPSVRSGEVLDDYQTSWIETALTGPGRLQWFWKASSEADYDFFHARLDGVSVASISGEAAWRAYTLEVPAGAHAVRWSYEKDPYLAVGTDSVRLAALSWARGYELWAEAAALVGSAADFASDADGDGVNNLLEYAFSRNPATADGLGEVVSVSPSNAPGAEGALEITFDHPSGREDLFYTVEVSGDLITWAPGHTYGVGAVNGSGLPTEEVSRTSLGGGAERIRVRDTAGAGAPSRFIRVRVQRE